jgi:spermidine synthase
MSSSQSRLAVHVMVVCAGLAALSWEVIWQLRASLALGVSAQGTAITLATLMGGMTLGALAMGRWLRGRNVRRPVRLYGALEALVGISGLALAPAFAALERVDASLYAQSPTAGPWTHLIGIALILGPPTLAMGATIPVFGLMARQFDTTISRLYGLNTLGAAIGTLGVAFFVLPLLGVFGSAILIAAVDILVCAVAFALPEGNPVEQSTTPPAVPAGQLPASVAMALVAVTGFATFALEIAWFRALRSALWSTTEAFAVMLAAVLLALAAATRIVPYLQREKVPLGGVLAASGVVVVLVTPLIERFDQLAIHHGPFYLVVVPMWFALTLTILGPPIFLLGVPLPWLLDRAGSPKTWSRLYAINTIAAVFGAIGGAWVLLPLFGLVGTSCLIGALLTIAGIAVAPSRARVWGSAALVAALVVAFFAQSGVGKDRLVGRVMEDEYTLLDFREGPDATVAVVEYENGDRALVIDGFQAASEHWSTSYMAWMGHLPMMLHPDPQAALIICMGTGQTTNGVRHEGPQTVDVVDINARVFEVAHYFDVNEGVLDDPRVTANTMDGRAWLRRTEQTYDVVTLEPMPPFFAGVNALYSQEFYELAAAAMSDDGVAAQWVPFHLLSPYHSASVAATFQAVFDDSVLWVDPEGRTGILLGRKSGQSEPLTETWPGFDRPVDQRLLPEAEVAEAVRLDREGLRRYSAMGDVITDDNQMLAYGGVQSSMRWLEDSLLAVQLELVEQAGHGVVTLP